MLVCARSVLVVEPDRWWATPAIMTGIEAWIMLLLLWWVLRVGGVHHVVRRHGIVEASVHASRGLGKVGRLLLLRVVCAVLGVNHAGVGRRELRQTTVHEGLLGRNGEATVAILVKEDTVILCTGLLLGLVPGMRMLPPRILLLLLLLREVVITERLLTHESKLHLPLHVLSLLSWHELLSMLIWVGELTATLLV